MKETFGLILYILLSSIISSISIAKSCVETFQQNEPQKTLTVSFLETQVVQRAPHEKVLIQRPLQLDGARKIVVAPTGKFAVYMKEESSINGHLFYILNLSTGETQIMQANWKHIGVPLTSITWNAAGSAFSYTDFAGNIFVSSIKIDNSGSAAPVKTNSSHFEVNTRDHDTRWSFADRYVFSRGLDVSRILEVSTGNVLELSGVQSAVWDPLRPVLFYTDAAGNIFSYSPETKTKVKIQTSFANTLFGTLTKKYEKQVQLNPLVELIESSKTKDAGGSVALISQPNYPAQLSIQFLVKYNSGQVTIVENKTSRTLKNPSGLVAGVKYLQPVSPDGRYLVTTQETGKTWFTQSIAKPNRGRPGSRDEWVEFRVHVRDLKTNSEYVFYENYVKDFYGGSQPNRYTVLWNSSTSFTLGRIDGGLPPIRWELNNGKQTISHLSQSKVVFSNLIRPRTPTVLETNENLLVYATIEDNILKIRLPHRINDLQSIELPIADLLGRESPHPNFTKIVVHSITPFRQFVLDIAEAWPGGTISHIVKVDLL